jgi:uncharacterized protein with PQ loop repeat
MLDTIDLLAYVAAVLLLAMSVPQTIRSYRHGTQGVSSVTWLLVGAATALWTSYGLAHHVPVLVLANAAALVGACATLVVLAVARGRSLLLSLIAVTLAATAALAVGVLAPLPLVTAGAVGLPILSRIPQVWACVQAFAAARATEVSRATWVMSMAGQTLWLIYGLAYSDGALIAVNSICVGLTMLLLAADIANSANRTRDELARGRFAELDTQLVMANASLPTGPPR